MGRIVVVSTGGTIASRWQGSGFGAAALGRELLAATVVPDGIEIEVVDLITVNSALLTTGNQLALLRTVHSVLADPAVDGVVVTHGTDTMEESAFLLELYHGDRRPVVFTGAQRPLDATDSDAGRNLADAIRIAATVRGTGVVIVFDGVVHAARGTVKLHTVAADAFGDPSGSALGYVGMFDVTVASPAVERGGALDLPKWSAERPRVDIVMHHCDADTTLFDAALAAGAEGIVLVGTGAGNATPEFTAAVSRAVSGGTVVALTTRVASGPVTPMYVGGGAVDLVAAGAVPTGTLRAGQARVATLAALLASSVPDIRARTLREIVGSPVPAEELRRA
jgi:L-asparaginase